MCMRRRIHVYEEEDTCVLYGRGGGGVYGR
jgi:hypothetical protein